ncbi:MAG: hypothetical protein MUF64_02935 [Polyangiaceae bacterium]|jgi:hypothetical protein|nr:hypothetical protein [Polyangiaceae bacterium]
MAISEHGRWGGRLTSRPLPATDASIEALADEERGELVDIWQARAASELRVATSFEVIAADLRVLRADPLLVALAERGIDDEHRHHQLCLLVASRLKGAEVEPPEPLLHAVPQHPGAPERLLPSLHVLGHCVMNETFASAFLEASLAAAQGPVTQAAVRELLSDEIDHARIGWAYLASATAQLRSELQPWLLDVAQANLRMWRQTPRAYPTNPRVVEQGAPSALLVEQALGAGLRDLIVPGLEHLGFDVSGLHAWLDAGAPT